MHYYNICYSLDFQYLEQLCASIASVLVNSSQNEFFNFFILDGGLSSLDKFKIEMLKNIKNFNIEYIEMNNNDFKNCPMLKDKGDNYKNYHVTLPTYYRFLLPDILPNIDNILYLDCDVIIRGSLKNLFEENIDNTAIAMVLDAETKKEAERIGIDNYFNAGVMLINLDYWRKNNVKSRLFDYAEKNSDKILWQDQDIVNAVLSYEIKKIPEIWNYQYFQYEKNDVQSASQAVIIHLAGRFKPWLMPFESEIYDEYYYYLNFTPFKNKILQYRLMASGKRLKDNIGGSVTNIVLNATDKDLLECFNAITKGYEYTNEQIAIISAHLTENFDLKFHDFQLSSDLKFSEIYNYTNGYASNLYKELKSSNSNIEHNLLNKINELFSLNNDLNNKVTDLKNETSSFSTVEMLNSEISHLKQIIQEQNINHSIQLNNLKLIYDEQLNNQRIKYEKKLIDMENQLTDMNSTISELLSEFKKTPLQRIKKHFRKKK